MKTIKGATLPLPRFAGEGTDAASSLTLPRHAGEGTGPRSGLEFDTRSLVATCAVLVFGLASSVHAAEPLNDEQLDSVTAGAANETQELLEFNVKHESASGRRVSVDGAIDVDQARSIENAALLLQDSAQSNLQSLININAVHSAVNVLVNLNITVDSQVGEIRQLNLANAMPRTPAGTGN